VIGVGRDAGRPVYGFINIKNGRASQQYIGSSLNLYERLTDHIKGVSSNVRLQRSIAKHGLDSVKILIFYSHTDPAVLLTEIFLFLDKEVIKSVPFDPQRGKSDINLKGRQFLC
jgi:hypothetical protein